MIEKFSLKLLSDTGHTTHTEREKIRNTFTSEQFFMCEAFFHANEPTEPQKKNNKKTECLN